MSTPRFRSQQPQIHFQIQKGRARGRSLLQNGSRLQRGMGRREKAQAGPRPPLQKPWLRLQRPPKLRGLQPVSLLPFSVQEVYLDWGSRASPSLGPWETPKGRVAPGHFIRASVALPCSSSLSTGALDATVGRGGRGGGREMEKTERAAHQRPGGGAQEQFPHLATQCTHRPSSLLFAHISTAKAITAGARETF